MGYGHSISHVWMWELDHKDSTEELIVLNCGAGKDFWASLGYKEIKPVNPKGNQPWIHIGMTDDKAEAPILWPSDVNSQFTGKDHDTGRYWKEKRVTEWDGCITHSMDMNLQTSKDGEGQGGLACCSPWDCKELDMTTRLLYNHICQSFDFWDYFAFSQPTGFLVAQLVKNSPEIQETSVRTLGQEDTLEKGTSTYSSILAWRIPQNV